MPARLGSFRVPRYILARLAAEEYVRVFWWFISIVPLFGLVALLFGRGMLQAIGTIALLWPVTIPIRSVFSSLKAGRFFSKTVEASVDDEFVYFAGEAGSGMKLPLCSIRKLAHRHGYLLLLWGIGAFVALPENEIDAEELERRIAQSHQCSA